MPWARMKNDSAWVMMLQLWLESPERLRPDEIQRLKQVFDRTRIRVLETVRTSPEAVVAADSNQH